MTFSSIRAAGVPRGGRGWESIYRWVIEYIYALIVPEEASK